MKRNRKEIREIVKERNLRGNERKFAGTLKEEMKGHEKETKGKWKENEAQQLKTN